jgi:copper chaperone CopZ
MTYYLHSVPGRLRVKIPQLRHRPAMAAVIGEALSFDGVRDVKIKPLTGSVVVHYDPALLDEARILQALAASGHFDPSRAISCDTHLQAATSKVAQKCGRAVFGWAVGRALEANGLGLLAAFI